jgi:NAD(P)-dependent dehydrogenase (short-subunit alcohol dehydrogenase family)
LIDTGLTASALFDRLSGQRNIQGRKGNFDETLGTNKEMSNRAIVTGAASGIGLAAARRLRAQGMEVVAVDLPGERLDALAGEGMKTLPADLSHAEERDKVVGEGTGARALVNSAGIIRLKPILEFTVEDIHKLFAVNVDPVWDLTSRIGRTMPPGGSIVNLSSSSAKRSVTTDAAVYAASKAVVLSLTRSFAYAFASASVRVNALCPGIIDTPMADDIVEKSASARRISTDEAAESRIAGVPLARTGSPKECANLIWFLVSNESSYMTGQGINITGGLIMY